MTQTTTHTLIYLDELRAELSNTKPCQDCAAGLAVHVEANGDWTVVQLHAIPCVNGIRGTR